MAGAISPIANGIDAAYYNPAAIGGIRSQGSRPAIHRLYFPYFAAAVNEDTVKLNDDLSNAGDLNDPAIVEQILRARDGNRQYGRLSVIPSITFWRTMLSFVYDTQMAAASIDESSDEIDVHSRTEFGPSLGFSFATNDRTFALGLYLAYLEREEIQTTLPFATLNDPDLRKSAFKDGKAKYTGMPIHLGTLWTISKKWNPTLSLAFRNVGTTKFRASDTNNEDLEVEEDMTLGFGLSPALGKWGFLSFTLEASRLTDSDLATAKKLRTGLEFSVGDRFGSDAGLSLRSGYNNAGLSYGLGFNLGILGLNGSSFAEDVGVNNKRVIERRYVVNFAVNVADF